MELYALKADPASPRIGVKVGDLGERFDDEAGGVAVLHSSYFTEEESGSYSIEELEHARQFR